VNWWHIARTPDGVYATELDTDDVDEQGVRAALIRSELDFPEDWVTADGWDSQLSQGEPHPSLLAHATVTRAS
jgi:hypothetical protein